MAHVYDYAIIGSGLTGLSIAAALSRETKNIALIDGADFVGGVNRSAQFPTGKINNGIRFIPATNAGEKALLFLENLLGLKLIKGTLEAAPVTYDSGQLKPFVGFGANPPPFWEELSHFTCADRYELNLEPWQWPALLAEKFQGDVLTRSYVTKINMEGDRAVSLTINGSKTLLAQNIIYTGPTKSLALLLPEDAISMRARTKLSKETYWTSIGVDICHNNVVTENPSMHVLNGTTQDEIGPCAGHFLPAVTTEEGKTLQASQWITFMEDVETEDSEIVGLALKKIKRQIKRAYPEALENIVHERIIVNPMIGGYGDLKLSANQTLPSMENLWIASPTLNSQKNLVGALLQAEMVVNALGFTIEHQILEPDNQERHVQDNDHQVEANM